MVTPPAIGGSSLGYKKDTAYCWCDREEEPNEEENPRKHIQSETITKYSAPPGTVSMSKMLTQTDNKCSKVYVKHGKWFWCEICDIYAKNRCDCDFTIGCWGEQKRNGDNKKELANDISITELKKKENTGDILNKKEKKQLNFWKKSNNLPLTDLLLKKRKNGDGGTKTPYAYGVENGSNAKTALVTSPLPKRNVQTREGIFADYMNIYFQANISAYIQ